MQLVRCTILITGVQAQLHSQATVSTIEELLNLDELTATIRTLSSTTGLHTTLLGEPSDICNDCGASPQDTCSLATHNRRTCHLSEIHTTIPTQSFCLDKTKQPLTKSKQNNLHSVHTRPCRLYEQSGPNNKQQSTTHGNAPKGSGSYLRPKTHIQHTHPQHLSTSTQTSTNHKSTHCNRMG